MILEIKLMGGLSVVCGVRGSGAFRALRDWQENLQPALIFGAYGLFA